MSKNLNGVWKIKSSDNFDEYMKEIGVNFATRKMGNLAKPVLTINIDGNDLHFKSESSFRNLETKATIGTEWDEETPDGRTCKSIFEWKGNKLVQTQHWDGKSSTLARWLEGEELKMELVCGEVKATRIYVKKE